MVKNLPASAGDVGSVPGLGRCYKPRATKPVCRNDWAQAPQREEPPPGEAAARESLGSKDPVQPKRFLKKVQLNHVCWQVSGWRSIIKWKESCRLIPLGVLNRDCLQGYEITWMVAVFCKWSRRGQEVLWLEQNLVCWAFYSKWVLMGKNSFYLPDSHPLCQFIDFDVRVLNINIHTDLKV